MPQIKIDKIVSFSSEDQTYPVNNILSSDPVKKWKCQNVGEKSSTVVLQLDKAYNISKIDIGNEHSAYIEILVSRSTSPEDYKVLLVMSSFMSPTEARESRNVNKVRMFTKDDLSEPEKNEKWDRIKVVCTQPFNRHVQYGLSFIHFYTNESTDSDKPSAIALKPLDLLSFGKFSVRPASPDSFSPGTLFSKKKELSQESPALKGAAAIREAQSLAQISSPLAKKIKQTLATPGKKNTSLDPDQSTETPKPRNRNELLYNDDEVSKNEKIDKNIEKKLKEKEIEKAKKEKEDKIKKEKQEKLKKEKDEDGKKKKKDDTKTPSKDKERTKASDIDKDRKNKLDISLSKDKAKTPTNNNKRKTDSASSVERPKPKKAKISKPFEKLLENVVLVISGIQNPERASLRSMALSMGAKYKPDWDDRCTHLVCAFANTPKFNQVKGKGKIVKKSWIHECYNERKRLPWRRYALDKADIGTESEDEIWEKENSLSPTPTTSYSAKDDSGSDTDVDAHLRDEGSDTEEKLRKIQENMLNQSKKEEKQQRSNTPPRTDNIRNRDKKEEKELKRESLQKTDKQKNGRDFDKSETDIYNVDTDSGNEHDDEQIRDLRFIENNLLEDYFGDKLFYVDDVFDKDLRMKLKQYIVAYKGLIVDELDATVEVMITTKDNSSFLKDLFPSATCVSPEWIWKCHNSQKLVLMDEYAY